MCSVSLQSGPRVQGVPTTILPEDGVLALWISPHLLRAALVTVDSPALWQQHPPAPPPAQRVKWGDLLGA